MTLHIYKELEQDTDEWLQARCGIVTASVIGQLITSKTLKVANNETARTLTTHLVAERITNYVEPTFTSADMERGTLAEPYARDKYAEHHAPVEEIGFMKLEHEGFRLGYSPDGLVGEDGIIEIKAPRQKKHLATILADEVPAEHMAQIQAGLLVSGREWCDFISYCGGMPLWVRRVLPDPKWHAAITEAVEQFETNATAMTLNYLSAVKDLPETERIEYFPEMEIF